MVSFEEMVRHHERCCKRHNYTCQYRDLCFNAFDNLCEIYKDRLTRSERGGSKSSYESVPDGEWLRATLRLDKRFTDMLNY